MSENQKKVLIDLIKEELNKEITEIENIPTGNYAPICGVSKVAWEISGSTGVWVFPKNIREMADRLFPEANQPKSRTEGEITASNIGKKDFDEIISLIQRVNKLRQEENQKREQKRKEKLTTNPNLFFYWSKSSSGELGAQLNRRFEGRKDGKEFYLYIPATHPALTNIPFAGQQSNDNKVNHFYLIEGFEVPTETHYHDYTDTYFYEESIELTDPISIIPYQGNSEEGDKLNSENLVEPKATDSTGINIKVIEKIFEEEWKNKDNKNIIDIRIGMLIKLLQSCNIRSIELTPVGELSIKYQDNSSEVLRDTSSEKVIIESYLKTVNEKDLDQQKLEKLQASFNSHKTNSPTNSPKSSFVPYLIGGAVVIAVLGAIWVSYRLSQKKNKNK